MTASACASLKPAPLRRLAISSVSSEEIAIDNNSYQIAAGSGDSAARAHKCSRAGPGIPGTGAIMP